MNAALLLILASIIDPTFGNKSQLSAPPHYSFDDAQLLYYWTFDGPDITFTTTGSYQMAAHVGANATWVASGLDSGSFFATMNYYIRPGIAGQGEFILSNGNLRVTNVNLSAVSLMTITAWIRPANVLLYNADKMFIEGGATDWSLQTNAIIIDTGNGARDFTMGIRSGVNLANALTKTCKNTNAFPASNIWYNVAFVFDNTTANGNVKLFVNATNVTLTAGSNTKGVAGNFGNHYWSFFGRGSGGSLVLPSTLVDEMRIYTNELTTAQLSEIYTNTAQRINTP